MKMFNVAKSLIVVSLTTAALLLTACGPKVPMSFGVPTSEFNKMSKSAQKQTIANYNKQQAQSAEEQSVFNLLGAAGSMIHSHKTISSSSSEHCSGPANNRTCSGSSSSTSFNIN